MVEHKMAEKKDLLTALWYDGMCCSDLPSLSKVSTRTGNMGRHFPVREKSGHFEQTVKITQNTGKVGILDKCYLLFLSDI